MSATLALTGSLFSPAGGERHLSDLDLTWKAVSARFGDLLCDRPESTVVIAPPLRQVEIRIVIAGEAPPWFGAVAARISEILDLPPNWDSYGGHEIDPDCIRAALWLLFRIMRDDTPAPSVVPTSTGSVQLEWHESGLDVEIEVVGPYRYEALYANRHTGAEWERTIEFDLRVLSARVGELSPQARSNAAS